MSKALFSTLSILVLLLSGINCATSIPRSTTATDATTPTDSTIKEQTQRRGRQPALRGGVETERNNDGEVAAEGPYTKSWWSPSYQADVLETAIEVLRAAGYEIEYRDDLHIRSTNGNKNVTLVVLTNKFLNTCLVCWEISTPTGSYATTDECDDFSRLERALGIN